MLKVKRAADLGGRPLRVYHAALLKKRSLVPSNAFMEGSTVAVVSVWRFAKKSWGVMGAEFWAESEYGQGFEVPIYDLCPKEVQP